MHRQNLFRKIILLFALFLSVIESSVAADSAKESGKGKWLTEHSQSPIDDSDNLYIALVAENWITLPYRKPSKPLLIIRCAEGKTDFFVSWWEFIGSDTIDILHRVDSEKAVTSMWYISTNYKSTFKKPSIPFIKSLFGHEVLLLRIIPHVESPVTATFDLTGLSEAIKPIQAACHWDSGRP